MNLEFPVSVSSSSKGRRDRWKTWLFFDSSLFSTSKLYLTAFAMHAYLADFCVVTQRSSFLGRSVARRHGILNNKKFLLGILPNTRLTFVQQLACVASISNRVFARKLGRELPNFDNFLGNFLDETDELPMLSLHDFIF